LGVLGGLGGLMYASVQAVERILSSVIVVVSKDARLEAQTKSPAPAGLFLCL
jgi:hypothetical protein